MLMFELARTRDDILRDLIVIKNKQSVLKIKENYKIIDNFFDDLAEEYQSIQSYENHE